LPRRRRKRTRRRVSYHIGARFERKVKKWLESQGWWVIRSAGSKGPVDLVAYKEGPKLLFIQCKKGKSVGSSAISELYDAADQYGFTPYACVATLKEGKIHIYSHRGTILEEQ